MHQTKKATSTSMKAHIGADAITSWARHPTWPKSPKLLHGKEIVVWTNARHTGAENALGMKSARSSKRPGTSPRLKYGLRSNPVPDGQARAWLYQDALPGSSEKYGAAGNTIRSVETVDSAMAVAREHGRSTQIKHRIPGSGMNLSRPE